MTEKAEKGLVFPLFRPLPPQKQSFYPIFFAGNKKSSNFGGENKWKKHDGNVDGKKFQKQNGSVA
ncbi:MAG: hypothetical protein IJ635_08985 [Bacteroidaceae bacterium]|nr:hypothetical protein [Bacteroidaceae bacterium]